MRGPCASTGFVAWYLQEFLARFREKRRGRHMTRQTAREVRMAFDTTWETEVYGQGRHCNRYPYDAVVSFLFRYCPRDRPRAEVRLLEVGCGAGNNLWFAAREGVQVSGVDGSASAIRYARERFAAEGLEADLREGDFTALPYPDHSFDLVVDRQSIVCCDADGARAAVGEVWRVLRPGGVFLHNSYSTDHFSRTQGTLGADGMVHGIRAGTLAGMNRLRFYTEAESRALFAGGWQLESMQHLCLADRLGTIGDHSEWRVVARKPGA